MLIRPFDRRTMLGGLAVAGLTAAWRRAQAAAMAQDISHLTPEQRERYEAMHARMMEALAFERVTVPGAHALAEWERLKTARRGWPVVVGDDEGLERIADQFSMEDPQVSGVSIGSPARAPGDILEAAARLRFPADLARWPGAYREEDLRAPVGEWPEGDADEAAQADGLTIARNLRTGQAFERVHILLISTPNGWEVPAYLRWGDWNACPPPEYHVAALHSWHERYGVELVGIDGDTMNLRAARRPTSRDEALVLARELYHYCPDIVDQGTRTISVLAALLMSSDWWFFWWD
jgi:hypothetical protein